MLKKTEATTATRPPSAARRLKQRVHVASNLAREYSRQDSYKYPSSKLSPHHHHPAAATSTPSKATKKATMGKKKGAKKGAKGADSDEEVHSDSDLSGKRSGGGRGGGDASDDDENDNVFDALVEKLSSRTQEERDGAIRDLRTAMQASPDAAACCEESSPALTSGLSRIVRNSAAGQEKALQVAQVSVLFFADEPCLHDVANSLAVLALYVAKNSKSTGEEVREALRLLTLCHLVCGPMLALSGDEDVPSTLYEIWNGKTKDYPAEAFAEALSCWLVCHTLLETNEQNEELDRFFAHGQKVMNIVENVDYDLSCSALEVIGFMYEAADHALGRPPPGLGRKDPLSVLEDVLQENDKSVKKTQRKERKELVRAVQASMEGEESQQERIQVGAHKLEFDGWKQKLQLDFLRPMLMSGLVNYLKANDWLRTLLDIAHLSLGAAQSRRDRREVRRVQVESSKESSKLKTMKDHKKSSQRLRAQFADE